MEFSRLIKPGVKKSLQRTRARVCSLSIALCSRTIPTYSLPATHTESSEGTAGFYWLSGGKKAWAINCPNFKFNYQRFVGT